MCARLPFVRLSTYLLLFPVSFTLTYTSAHTLRHPHPFIQSYCPHTHSHANMCPSFYIYTYLPIFVDTFIHSYAACMQLCISVCISTYVYISCPVSSLTLTIFTSSPISSSLRQSAKMASNFTSLSSLELHFAMLTSPAHPNSWGVYFQFSTYWLRWLISPLAPESLLFPSTWFSEGFTSNSPLIGYIGWFPPSPPRVYSFPQLDS